MAGFHGKIPYWVGRAFLELEHSVAWYERKLLPHLETWRQQAASANGDKSLLCNKVLNHIIPYFLTVMIQDGIYFVNEFKDHPTSILLIVSTPNRLCVKMSCARCIVLTFLLITKLFYLLNRTRL
jgi:hypothetical protein